jgi:hypothetical protein
MTNIYRFKFSKQLYDILIPFVNNNKYSDTNSFNDNWNTWLIQYKNIIDNENKLLLSNGYQGDINIKLYKSAKYYYKNKIASKNKSIKKRKKYLSIDIHLLNLIDNHINTFRINIKPHYAYTLFMDSYKNDINLERKRLSHILNNIQFNNKMKKTYKNRFYILNKL